MSKIEILVIGRNEEILQTVVRLVNNNAKWNATGAVTDELAIAEFKTVPFKLVLLGGGIGSDSERRLRNEFTAHKPDIVIIQHYGGGSGLLTAEICNALAL